MQTKGHQINAIIIRQIFVHEHIQEVEKIQFSPLLFFISYGNEKSDIKYRVDGPIILTDG